MNVLEIERTNATEAKGKYFFLVSKMNFHDARRKATNWLPNIYKRFLTKEEIKEEVQPPRLMNIKAISNSVEELNNRLIQMANEINLDQEKK